MQKFSCFLHHCLIHILGCLEFGVYALQIDDKLTICFVTGITLDSPIITSCGTGVTACILALVSSSFSDLYMSIKQGYWCFFPRHVYSENPIF